MDFYVNACEQFESAEILAASGKYRVAVTLLCLSCELFLKSLVERKDPKNPLLDSHDIVGLGRLIRDDINYSVVASKLTFMRKYLNDSRYPFDSSVYTAEFYQTCLESVLVVRQEIDSVNAKKSTVELLSERFGKDKIKDETNKQ